MGIDLGATNAVVRQDERPTGQRQPDVRTEEEHMAMARLYLRDEEVTGRGNWIPPVDIYETEARDLVVKAELPDMTREDIEVTVENDTLVLRGTKKLPDGVTEEQIRRIERSFGAFTRSFTLPSTVDAAKVTAEYKNGVLTVRLPYREEARPRTIAIDVAA